MSCYDVIVVKNLIECTEKRYYCFNFTTACNFTRQLQQEYNEAGWNEDVDYAINRGDDLEHPDITEDNQFERLQPGVYTDAE